MRERLTTVEATRQLLRDFHVLENRRIMVRKEAEILNLLNPALASFLQLHSEGLKSILHPFDIHTYQVCATMTHRLLRLSASEMRPFVTVSDSSIDQYGADLEFFAKQKGGGEAATIWLIGETIELVPGLIEMFCPPDAIRNDVLFGIANVAIPTALTLDELSQR